MRVLKSHVVHGFFQVQHVSSVAGPQDPLHENCTAVSLPNSVKQPVADTIPQFDGLRDVHISYELLQLFLRYVESNTKKGIESCGLLAGIIISTCHLRTFEGTPVVDRMKLLQKLTIFLSQVS